MSASVTPAQRIAMYASAHVSKVERSVVAWAIELTIHRARRASASCTPGPARLMAIRRGMSMRSEG
ncbi:MAG: hypothetical protein R2698_12700 [Microthrixaceae bacterium]